MPDNPIGISFIRYMLLSISAFIFILAVLFALAGISLAADLDAQILRLASFAAIDYHQSVHAFFHETGYYELNPLLGPHPSRQSLALFGASGVGLVYIATRILPAGWAEVVVDSVVASEQYNIEENARLASGAKRTLNAIPIIISWRF